MSKNDDEGTPVAGIHNYWPYDSYEELLARQPRAEDEEVEVEVEVEDDDEYPAFRNPNEDDVTGSENRKAEATAPSALTQEQDENRPPVAGRLTQWAYHGMGFIGTTRTVGRIPTATYRVAYDQRAGWTLQPLPIVTDHLYRLPDTKSDSVIEEIRRFWTLGQRFKDLGYTHKRGFLLYGPPGSGKTSTIAMATQQMLDMDGIVIFADIPSGISAVLYQVRQIEPDRPLIVIIEDIDTVIHKYGESEVLSILDGENSVGNIVFLATTNYPEKLDGRVVNRPSRFDKVVKIGMPNAAARRLYLMNKGVTADEVDKWVELSQDFSIAHLKEMIVCVKCFDTPLEDVAERLHKMAKPPKSDDPAAPVGFGSKT